MIVIKNTSSAQFKMTAIELLCDTSCRCLTFAGLFFFSFPRIISPEGTAGPTELEPWLNSSVALTGLFGNLLETSVLFCFF